MANREGEECEKSPGKKEFSLHDNWHITTFPYQMQNDSRHTSEIMVGKQKNATGKAQLRILGYKHTAPIYCGSTQQPAHTTPMAALLMLAAIQPR